MVTDIFDTENSAKMGKYIMSQVQRFSGADGGKSINDVKG